MKGLISDSSTCSFIETFDMQHYKIYLTGESYAGYHRPAKLLSQPKVTDDTPRYFISYIGSAFLDAKDTKHFNLKGASLNDPIIGDENSQLDAFAVPYLNYWSNAFGLNSTYTAHINKKHHECGYADFIKKHLVFPAPKKHFPPIFPHGQPQGCDTLTDITLAALELNPCFNTHHIFDTCPFLYSAFGSILGYDPPGSEIYFQRHDVQRAINAPVGTKWYLGTSRIFRDSSGHVGDTDATDPPAFTGALQKVIEGTNNTIIGVGGLDFLIPINSTLLVLQNLTWNGQQGFSMYPSNAFYVPYHPEYNPYAMAGAGDMGTWNSERGLTFYTVHLAGHGKMIPEIREKQFI